MALPGLLTAAQFSTGTGGKIAASDPRVPILLAGATAGIRRYCRWHVAPVVEAAAVRFDGPGGHLLVLPTLRLTAVGPLVERGVPLVDDVDYEWSANGEIRRLRGRWTTRYRAITATFSHGFPAEDTPLAAIVQQVVANAVASPMGATREQAAQISIQWAQTAPGVAGGISLLERDLALLDLYRLP